MPLIRLNPMSLLRRWQNRGSRVGLACSDHYLALIGLDGDPARDFKLRCGFSAATADPGERRRLLSEWVTAGAQRGAPTVLTLLPETYQLLQIERPPVKTEELAQAVRWRIKDFLDYPLDEAAIDVFELPDSRHRGRPALIQVVAARVGTLREWTRLAAAAGLAPWKIDIAELALRNLTERVAAATAAAEDTVATLCLLPDTGIIQLTRGAQLYLTRALDFGLTTVSAATNASADTAPHERLALELQRTMDYADSQFGLSPARRLLLLPAQPRMAHLAQAIGGSLGLSAGVATLDHLLDPGTVVASDWPATTLLALGGGLANRTESTESESKSP